MVDVLYRIAYVVSVVFETCVVYVFFKNVLKKSRVSKKWERVCYAVFMLFNIFCILFFKQQLVVLLLFFLSVSLLSLIYDCKKSVQIVSIVTVTLIGSISEIIMGLLLSSLLKISVGEIIDNIIYYTTGMLTSKFLSFLCVKIIGSNYNPNDNPLGPKLAISFLVLPVVSLFVGVVLIGAFGKNLSNTMGLIGTISMIMLTSANLLVFYLFERYSAQLQKQNIVELENEKMEREKEYLKELVDRQNTSNRVMHDLKNKLFVIKTQFENNSDDALETINNICDIVMSKESIMYTKNESIDALINSKKSKMDDCGISFKCNSYVVSFQEVDDIDICAIIGNLLDNATEACMKLDGEKNIVMNIRQANNCMMIEVANTVDKAVEIIDGKIQTTKKDKNIHGIGTKNIADIAKRYNGTLEFESTDEIFKAAVVLIQEAA